jgi:hypothetical protein
MTLTSGGGEELGRCGPACVHAREKEAGGPGQFAGCRKGRKRKAGRGGGGKGAAREEKGKGERFGVFFFLNYFQNRFSNFQTSLKQETMHSNHDAHSLIISNFI